MQRFSIFIKSKDFNWSANKIAFLIFVILFVAFHINKNFPSSIQTDITEFIGIIGLSGFVIGTIYKFTRIVKPEKPHGQLTGFLELKLDSINIDRDEYKIEEIENIHIVNNDFYGKGNGSSGGFGSNLSNGVHNYLTLTLKDQRKISCMFEMYNEYDMGKLDEVLINYYSKGKLELHELLKILKVKGDKDIEDFKKFLPPGHFH